MKKFCLKIKCGFILAAVFAAILLSAFTALRISAIAANSDGKKNISCVYLNDGNVISGEILKTKADSVVIDNEVSVFVIPKGKIQKIKASIEQEKAQPKALDESGRETSSRTSLQGASLLKLFPTRNSSVSPIENLVENFEDGVVQVKTPSGTGSGFIISDAGHLLTNCHVIENETQISVTLFEKAGSEFNQIKLNNIKIVALNPFYDLALLKIEDKTEKPLTKCYFSKSISWKKGESVFAIGNPYGLTRSISQGIISDKDRYVNGLIYIQTTAPINAGNSGGPLFDMRGDVIGVINMAYFRSDGIGFGIPLNYIYDFLTNVEAYSFDKDNPNSGFMYNRPPRRRSFDNIAE